MLNNTQNAINKNMTTYRELYDTALNKIKSICQNVSNYSGNVPSTVKESYTKTKSHTGTEGSSSHSKTVTARFRIKNSIPQVSASVVESQFDSYMNSCGFKSILGGNTTPRGEILFMMAVSEFITAKVYTVQGLNSSKVTCYNQDTTPTVVSYNSESTINAKDTNINGAILKNTAQVKVNYYHEFV